MANPLRTSTAAEGAPADRRHRPAATPPRPLLLAITSELPWPLNTGGHLRTYHLLASLADRFRIRLLTTGSSPSLLEAGIAELKARGIEGRAVLLKRSRWRDLGSAMQAALCREPYVLFRRHDQPAVRHLLREELAQEPPQILYLDHLDPWTYRSEFGDLPVVLDLHNVYSRLTARVAQERRFWPLRAYLRREARLLARTESHAVRSARVVFGVSRGEQDHFRSLGAENCQLIPNGVATDGFHGCAMGRVGAAPRILYLGAMSWPPNSHAAVLLAREILPQVRKEIANATLQIVGRNPPVQVQALASLPGVEVLGEVPDVRPYLAGARTLAVPLDSGGGTRLKILEAFAAGLPVVSTPVGCEGIDAVDGQHLLIAERHQMADALVRILLDDPLAVTLASNALRLAKTTYDWQVIGRAASEVIASILPDSTARRSASATVGTTCS